MLRSEKFDDDDNNDDDYDDDNNNKTVGLQSYAAKISSSRN
jgi:hypothetical protein